MGIIEQEHHVWSTFARASTSTANSNTISSLVFSDNFIYSYHLITGQWPGTHNHLFDLLIYARHGDAFDDNAVIGYSDIVETMQYCLEVGCTSLQSHWIWHILEDRKISLFRPFPKVWNISWGHITSHVYWSVTTNLQVLYWCLNRGQRNLLLIWWSKFFKWLYKCRNLYIFIAP